ncbi:Putative glycosyltransferase [Microbacterium sp. 8M]|uniref:glycosyltransferase n=1 Tax=Microbacterium sp. 8M TaxID=2653153 RepID=UPI0012F032BF|nr:glycosyltransferase [Microbacterium sp. 8M]VXB72689.1 Putative glycosyltransferase [Microbacterium sp. 8M]
MTGLIVHEWIEPTGGAELVLDGFARSFPDADMHCLWNDAPARYSHRPVGETWLARTPLRRHKAFAPPFAAAAWRGLSSRTQYDWLLASSHLFAHHAHVRNQDVPKYVYVHTPARYIWSPELDGRGDNPLVRAVSPLFRSLDHRRAQEPMALAANSRFVRDRIARTWERDSVVIHPPVHVEQIMAQADWRNAVVDDDELRVIDALPENFILGASRFIPYKRLDRVIAAAELVGLPVVIAGHGPETESLRALAATAKVPAYVIVEPSTAMMYALFQRASVLAFPPIEDFGIVPVEAQAAGTPVVVGPIGGQLETIRDGVSGIVAESDNPRDFAVAIRAALALPAFDPRSVVGKFSDADFDSRIRAFVGIAPVSAPTVLRRSAEVRRSAA